MRLLRDVQARSARGFSILELLVVVAIIGVISAIAVPQMSGLMGFLKIDGDARSLKNSVSLARMQAAANFAQTRIYLDTSTNGYHIETLPATAAAWSVSGGTTYLSANNESYGYGPVGTAPPNTQNPIAQAPACLNTATPPAAIANTRCIVFNSRGIPIDSTGAPTPNYALYLTDGSSVYGVTISATSAIKLWKTKSQGTPSWVQQ